MRSNEQLQHEADNLASRGLLCKFAGGLMIGVGMGLSVAAIGIVAATPLPPEFKSSVLTTGMVFGPGLVGAGAITIASGIECSMQSAINRNELLRREEQMSIPVTLQES